MIFSAHLPSVCFRSPSNSSLEAFSALLCCSRFLFAAPPLPLSLAITCSTLASFQSVPCNSKLLHFFLSVVCSSSPYLPHSSLPLSFISVFLYLLQTSHFFSPCLFLSSTPSHLHSLPLHLSTFVLVYIPHSECFSLSLILFFLFHSTRSFLRSSSSALPHSLLSVLPGIWSAVFLIFWG